MAVVIITQDASIERAIETALDQLPLRHLVSERRVAVKPNDTWASAEDTTGVTQPDTLRAVLRYLKRLEPAELLVSGGAGAAETNEVFRLAGLDRVLAEEVVPLIAMSFPAADYYGHPRGNQKHTHHFFEDMHSFIAAMARRFPIHAAITVGHPAMIATGPLGGFPVETGLCRRRRGWDLERPTPIEWNSQR
jgi:uncharacterized protein (DUF362 family)